MSIAEFNPRAEIRGSRLYFDGVDTVALAATYGTPLYVVSESMVRERCGIVRAAFLEKYPNTSAVYASKAFQTLDMCRIIASEGMGIDVVSGGELYAALKAGVDPETLIFHGNSKAADELDYAVRANVGRIVSDNLFEIAELERLGALYGRKVSVLYRVTPGVDSHTHRFISTGSLDSKFGIPLDPSVREKYMRAVLDAPHIDFRGFHFHIGSQLQDNFSHLAALKIVLKLVADAKADYGYATRELNLGGGFGIRYLPSDPRPSLDYFIDPMMELVRGAAGEAGIPMPKVTIEPGRWIIGEAGITLYTIRSVKTIPGIRTYVGVDGGMADNIRPALYEARYHALCANKADRDPSGETTVTVVGKCCETGDILIRDIGLPEPEPGDILAVFSTGAYNHSMASNYNRIPRPAVVMTSDGSHRLSVRRETYEDLILRER
ncbi:MAG TPA: diaminopimelate decarboxylase [Rectinemataceae bacterium]|nr:diaminopimelate decarboxylase [Rectinemataceae bacterium]